MKRILIITTIISVAFLYSCDKSNNGNSGAVSGYSIGIDKVSISNTLTKADAAVSESYSVESDDFSFEITETVEPMGVDTKADYSGTGVTTLDSLVANGFTVEGYLHSDYYEQSKANPLQDSHFFTEPASYSGSAWHFADTKPQWRDGVHHSFWAYAPAANLSNFSGYPDDGNASFKYTSDFNKDLVVAQQLGKYWDYESVCANDAHIGDGLDFIFKHALAGIKINYDIESKAVVKEEGATTTTIKPVPGRIQIKSVDIIEVKVDGTCTVNSGNSFSWTPGNTEGAATHQIKETESTATDGKVMLKGVSQKPDFVIPQTVATTFCFNIYDAAKKLTYPTFITLKNDGFDGSWKAGYMYGYNFEGSITAGYQPENIEGLKFEVDGHKFFSAEIITKLESKYISQIEISWDGIPQGNSATQGYVVLMDASKGAPVCEKNNEANNDVPYKFSNLSNGFPHTVYAIEVDGSNNVTVARGTAPVNGVASPTVHCSTGAINIPDDLKDKDLSVYVGFFGGNSSGSCTWFGDNFKIEVIKYK